MCTLSTIKQVFGLFLFWIGARGDRLGRGICIGVRNLCFSTSACYAISMPDCDKEGGCGDAKNVTVHKLWLDMRSQRHIIKAYPYSFGTVIVAMIVVLKFQ